MSSYFFQRIKNLPTTANNSNNSRLIQQTKQLIKSEDKQSLSDDELLTSALKFEQTSQFKQAEEQAKKAKGENIFCFSDSSTN
jgi:hypothetical protein